MSKRRKGRRPVTSAKTANRAEPAKATSSDMESSKPTSDSSTLLAKLSQDKWQWGIVGVIFCLAAGLAFQGLSNNIFWDDESNTALFARNWANQGQLIGWDGKNIIGFRNGAELNEELLNVYMPPMQYYVAGLSLKLFGNTTFAGRLPFVLCGLFALLALAWWARRFMGNGFPWWLPVLFTATSTSYLLYSRQCRYYALAVLCTMLLLAAFAHDQQGRKHEIPRYTIGVLSTIVLLFTNYLNAAAVFALLPFFLLKKDMRHRKNYIFVGVIYGVAFLLGIYILITANPFAANVAGQDKTPAVDRFFTLIGWHLSGLASFEFVPVVLVLLLGLPFVVKPFAHLKPLAKKGLWLVGALFLYTLVTVVFSPQPVSRTWVADMRYVVPLIAIGSVISAIVVVGAWRIWRPAAILITAIVIFSNALHLSFFSSKRPFTCTLCDYVRENANDYTTGTEAFRNYLQKLPKSAVVQIYPTYMTYPQMFYAPQHRYCCQLKRSKQLSPEWRRRLPSYLYADRVRPDVILAGGQPPRRMMAMLSQRYGQGAYRLDRMIPIYFRDKTRPELLWRNFGPADESYNRQRGIAVFVRNGFDL